MKINKLILQDFKFFNGLYELNFDANNVLIYGENGSGKSSIYWALYTFLQSSIKEDDEIKKYFDLDNSQNLINRYTDNPLSKICIELVDDQNRTQTFTISKETINTNKDDNTIITEANFASDFINYRILSRIYDFRNSQDIDLFEVFENDILDYIGLETIENAGKEWQYLKKGLNPRPNMNTPEYKEFQAKIRKFNDEFEIYLNRIIEDSNRFLNDEFKVSIKLEWDYVKATYDDFMPNSTTKRNHKTITPKIILKAKFLDDKVRNDNIQKPHTFLNEAKLTAIALSIRLAVLKERLSGIGLKILVLDDLLISLDMNNRDIVIDIILKQFSDMQILIMTHDEMFFEFVKHKIKQIDSQNWYFWKMYEDNRNIPKPYITDAKTYLQKAEEYLIKNEYEIAGNLLRKETENFCKDFLPKKNQYTKEYNLLDLNGLIITSMQFAENAGMNVECFQKLDGFRKFVLNVSSHDSYDVPKYKYETKECLETLKELNKIKTKPLLSIGSKLKFELKDNRDDICKVEFSLEDEFRVIYWNDNIFISKGMINYQVYKNNELTKNEIQHKNITLKSFYKGFYEKSNKEKSEDYLEEIIIIKTNQKLKDIILP